MNALFTRAASIKSSLEGLVWDQIRRRNLRSYLNSDRRPWRQGYYEYREQYLKEAIADAEVRRAFSEGTALPEGYAYRLDARMLEIPWVLSRLGAGDGFFLDAGSAFNHKFVLESPPLADKRVAIVTLAPEGDAFWKLGVSYVYGDLRRLDFRDDLFDAVACISTIEHVGMDNSMYAGNTDIAKRGDPAEFLAAVKELKRVLKPGGSFFVSFPFGRYENHGWFQQFDAELMDLLIDCFQPTKVVENIFRYQPEGWQRSHRASCANCEFFDVHKSKYFDTTSMIEYPPDFPAGERGLACLELSM